MLVSYAAGNEKDIARAAINDTALSTAGLKEDTSRSQDIHTMHDIEEEEACYTHRAEDLPIRLTSQPSSGSLPYDERQAYCSGKSKFHALNTTNNRPRRRSKLVSAAPSVKRRSTKGNTLTYRRSPYASTAGTEPPPPSLMAIGSAMINILSLYIKHNCTWLKKSCRRRRKFLLRSLGALCLFILMWITVLALGFYMDAVRMCTPPPDLNPLERPLVEYYIHGRGNGHYARSMAIIETLNDMGMDVRMFIGRAPIWNFFHQAKPHLGGKKGVTTAIAVTSIQPSLDASATISHILERIMGDCEVAFQTERYPLLVISDGDAPGMLRAYFGGIPSLAISHGQIFNIGKKPDWVLEDKRLNAAWDKQGWLNRKAALFSSWQIGTDFGYLETKHASAIVARPPLRPEVLQMAVSRKHVREGNPLMVAEHEIAQRMANLVLYGQEYVDEEVETNVDVNATSHRKIVLCYFRDHNGENIIDALLQAGFDVLFFETGYNKKFGADPNRFGVKWIVREEDRIRLREAAQFESGKKGLQTLQQHRRLSQDDESDGLSSNVKNEMEPQHRRLVSSDSSSTSPRMIRVADRALFVPFMSIADGIVASAGSQLISECIYANVPLLALYRTDDDEQVLNVELSRQERVMRRKIPVYGASFENFQAAYPTKYSYVRRSNRTTSTAPKLQPSGAKVARSEFESFVDKVDESIVSDAYFKQLQYHTNETMSDWHNATNWHNITTHADTDTEDDPFHGMPDAAAIILEIIKELENE